MVRLTDLLSILSRALASSIVKRVDRLGHVLQTVSIEMIRIIPERSREVPLSGAHRC